MLAASQPQARHRLTPQNAVWGQLPDARPSGRNPNLRLPRTSYLRASGRRRVYKTPTNPPSGALRLLAGKYFLPDAGNETLRSCRVRRVFVAKLLNDHLL